MSSSNLNEDKYNGISIQVKNNNAPLRAGCKGSWEICQKRTVMNMKLTLVAFS